MKNGFQLRFLRVSGKGKKPAELEFRPGLNVISGASNTGKSYICNVLILHEEPGLHRKRLMKASAMKW
jgi:hypothetical protein